MGKVRVVIHPLRVVPVSGVDWNVEGRCSHRFTDLLCTDCSKEGFVEDGAESRRGRGYREV